jgi:phosphatidylserine synthase
VVPWDAPSLLVYQIVLRDFYRTGWLIASSSAVRNARLARFNCYAAQNENPPMNSLFRSWQPPG